MRAQVGGILKGGTPHSREGHPWGRKTHRINNRGGSDEASTEEKAPRAAAGRKAGRDGGSWARCWLAGGPGHVHPVSALSSWAGAGLPTRGGRRGLSSGGRAAAVGSTGERLGVRCGEKLTFYAVSFYVFFEFFPLCMCFIFGTKQN